MSKFQPIGLGDRVKDPVSGFTGIVMSVTWLHGCIRMGVKSEKTQNGEPLAEQYFDQSQLVLLKPGVHTPMVMSVGPTPAPVTRRSNGGPAREGAGFSR